MKFHYEFDIRKAPRPVQHPQRILLIGSCFTENIGEKLRRHKFTTLENPHGILFNPVSVVDALNDYVDKRRYTGDDIFEYQETWHSWKHHSRYSGITEADCLERINTSIAAAHQFLSAADHLVITLGSAWTYTLTAEAPQAIAGTVAANNHKAPAGWFLKKLLQPEQVREMLTAITQKLLAFNPNLQLIFTISPVRHLREGVIENNRSKAVLIQAVHDVVQLFDQAYYFPAYELVIDDLRDYRFYAEDLVHPNYQATEYVWEKFTAACMTDDTKLLMKEIAEINLAYQHKPFNPHTAHHLKFLASYFTKTKTLAEKHDYLDFSRELGYFATAI